MRRIDDFQILSAKDLFEWGQKFFNKIKFDFCTRIDYEQHARSLKTRFSQARTIKNTRQYHSYVPIDDKKLDCKIFSEDNSYVIRHPKQQKTD